MIVTFTVEVGFPGPGQPPTDEQIADLLDGVVTALKTGVQDVHCRDIWITEHHLVEAAVSEYTVPAHTVNLP